MKTLGIIGGVSWLSSAEYYKRLNESVAHRLGGRHSARVVLTSLNFSDLLQWQKSKDPRILLAGLQAEARKLQAAGCEGFIIASHTLSWLGADIEKATGMEYISLFHAVSNTLKKSQIRRMGLIGTQYTMREPLYRTYYEENGFEVLTPAEPHFTRTAQIIYKELTNGVFRSESKMDLMRAIEHLVAQGAEAVVLGCTEIGLLISERSIQLAQTQAIVVELIETHAAACLDWMLVKPNPTVKQDSP